MPKTSFRESGPVIRPYRIASSTALGEISISFWRDIENTTTKNSFLFGDENILTYVENNFWVLKKNQKL
jgi:hypothetical protein